MARTEINMFVLITGSFEMPPKKRKNLERRKGRKKASTSAFVTPSVSHLEYILF